MPVPSSSKNAPPTADTNPAAAVIPVPPVKFTLSFTSYALPPVSIWTELTEPSLIVSTNTSANPLPLSESITNASESEWRIPSLSKLVPVITDLTVNVILVSVSFDVASICSPLSNVPLTFSNSNSDTEFIPCWNVAVASTTAVAPEVNPVITWLSISEDAPRPSDTHLILSFCFQLPFETFNIFSFG